MDVVEVREARKKLVETFPELIELHDGIRDEFIAPGLFLVHKKAQEPVQVVDLK